MGVNAPDIVNPYMWACHRAIWTVPYLLSKDESDCLPDSLPLEAKA